MDAIKERGIDPKVLSIVTQESKGGIIFSMIMTILKAKVAPERSHILSEAFGAAIKNTPPEIIKTYLVNDVKDPEVWQIITIWKNMEVLEEMRKKGTPEGVLMFRKAGAEPQLSIFNVDFESISV